jgi:hypothetical protein
MNLDDVRKEVPLTSPTNFPLPGYPPDPEAFEREESEGYLGLFDYVRLLAQTGRPDLYQLACDLSRLGYEEFQDLDRRFIDANPQINWRPRG